jgi:hypothetical protein
MVNFSPRSSYPLIPIGLESGWVQEPVWTLLSLLGTESQFLDGPAPSLAAVPPYEYLLGEGIDTTKRKACAIAQARCRFLPRPAARVAATVVIIIIMSFGEPLIT